MTEIFYRIGDSEIWCGGTYILFFPFGEIVKSKAPHLVINKKWRPSTIPPGVGQHVLVPLEVYELAETWRITPGGYAGYRSFQELLDSIYDN